MEYKSLQITEEEKDELKRYCEFEHRYINLITSADIKSVHKFDNPEINIFSKEYFNKAMNALKEIYSAMCKYSYGENGKLYKLVRGTTKAEVEHLKNTKECSKMLSSSTSELVAKQHCGSKVINGGEKDDFENVVLRLDIEGSNIPYINVNAVLGDESNHSNEEEIILAPFCQITDIDFVSKWDGIMYYSGDIKAPQMQIQENEEDIKTEIEESINKIPILAEKYRQAYGKYEIAINNEKYQTNADDIKVIMQIKEQSYEIFSSLQKEFDEIKQKIVSYAKSICQKVEEKIVEEVKEEKIQIEKSEIERKAKQLEENKINQINRLSQCISNIEMNVESIKQTSDRMNKASKILGLQWNTGISQEEISLSFAEIQKNGTNMRTEISEIKNEEENKAITYKIKIERIQEINEKIEKLAENYSFSNCKCELTKSLEKKVELLIRQSEMQHIDKCLEELENEKVGLFGIITGRKKELELKKQQLKLKKSLLQEKVDEKEETNVHSIYAKIIAYGRQNDGNLSYSLQEMLSNIKKVFRIDEVRIDNLVEEQIKQKALTVVEPDKSIFRTRQINQLTKENTNLEQQLQDIRLYSKENFRNQAKQEEQISNAPQALYNLMKKVNKVCDTKQKNNETDKCL